MRVAGEGRGGIGGSEGGAWEGCDGTVSLEVVDPPLSCPSWAPPGGSQPFVNATASIAFGRPYHT